jgi:hypothetical protein
MPVPLQVLQATTAVSVPRQCLQGSCTEPVPVHREQAEEKAAWFRVPRHRGQGVPSGRAPWAPQREQGPASWE